MSWSTTITVFPASTRASSCTTNGIRDWKAVGSDTLYVQDARRTWYRASLFGPCLDLPVAQTIGFETRGVDRLDRFSFMVVRGQRCALQSLVRSEPPPAKARRARS
jgi:hypothetical protein